MADRRNFPATLVVAGAATAVMLAAFIRNITRVQTGTNTPSDGNGSSRSNNNNNEGNGIVDNAKAEELAIQRQEAETARQEAADLNVFYTSFSSLFYQQMSSVKVTSLISKIRGPLANKGKSTTLNFFRSGPGDGTEGEADDDADLQWCDKYLGVQLPFPSRHLRLVHEERHNMSILLRFVVSQDSALLMGGGPAANHVPFSLDPEDNSPKAQRDGSTTQVPNVSLATSGNSNGQTTRQNSAELSAFGGASDSHDKSGRSQSTSSHVYNSLLFSSCVTVEVTITVPAMVGESLRRPSALSRREHATSVSNYAQVIGAGHIELEKPKTDSKTGLFGGRKKPDSTPNRATAEADELLELDASVDGQKFLDCVDDDLNIPRLEYCYVAEKHRAGAFVNSLPAQSSSSRAPSLSLGRADTDSQVDHHTNHSAQTPTWSHHQLTVNSKGTSNHGGAVPHALGTSGNSSANCSSPGSQYEDFTHHHAKSHSTGSFDRLSAGFADDIKLQDTQGSIKVIKQVRYVSALFRNGNGVEVMLTIDVPGPRLEKSPSWFVHLARGISFSGFPSVCVPVPSVMISTLPAAEAISTASDSGKQTTRLMNTGTKPEPVVDSEGKPKIFGFLPQNEQATSVPLSLDPTASYLYCTEPRHGVSFHLPLGFVKVVDPKTFRSSSKDSSSRRKRKAGGTAATESVAGGPVGSSYSHIQPSVSKRRGAVAQALLESHEQWCSAENTASYFFFQGSQAGSLDGNDGASPHHSSPIDMYDAAGSPATFDTHPQPIAGIIPAAKAETDVASNSIPFMTLKCEFTTVVTAEPNKVEPRPAASTLTARPSDVAKVAEALAKSKKNGNFDVSGKAGGQLAATAAAGKVPISSVFPQQNKTESASNASGSAEIGSSQLVETPDFRSVKVDHNRVMVQARYERYHQPKYGWDAVIPRVLRRTAARFRFHDTVIPFVLESHQPAVNASAVNNRGPNKNSSSEQIVMRPFESLPAFVKPHGAPRHNLLHKHHIPTPSTEKKVSDSEDKLNADASTLTEEVAMRAAAAAKSFPGASCYNPDSSNNSTTAGTAPADDYSASQAHQQVGAPLKGYFGAIEVIIKPPRPLRTSATNSNHSNNNSAFGVEGGANSSAALFSIGGSNAHLAANDAGAVTNSHSPSAPLSLVTSTTKNVFPDDGLGTLTTDGCIRALLCVYIVAVGGEYVSICYVAKKTSTFRMRNLLELSSFSMNSASRGNHYGQEPHMIYVQLRHGSPLPYAMVVPAGLQVTEPRLGDPTAVMSFLPEVLGRVVSILVPPHFSPMSLSHLTIRPFPCHPIVSSTHHKGSRDRAEALEVFKRECINFIHSLGSSYATLAPSAAVTKNGPIQTDPEQLIIMHENPNGPQEGGHVVIVETGALPAKQRARAFGVSSKALGGMIGFYFIHHHDLSAAYADDDNNTYNEHQDPNGAEADPPIRKAESARLAKHFADVSRPCVASQDSQPVSHEDKQTVSSSRIDVGRNSSLSSPPPGGDSMFLNTTYSSGVDQAHQPFVSSSSSSASQRYASVPACQFNPFDPYRPPAPNPLYAKHPLFEAYMASLSPPSGSFGGAYSLARLAQGIVAEGSAQNAGVAVASNMAVAEASPACAMLLPVTSEAASVSRRTNRSASRPPVSSTHEDAPSVHHLNKATPPTHHDHSFGAIEEISDLGATSTSIGGLAAGLSMAHAHHHQGGQEKPEPTVDGGETTAFLTTLGGLDHNDDNDAILRVISVVICVEGCAFVLQASSASRRDFPKVKKIVMDVAQSWLI